MEPNKASRVAAKPAVEPTEKKVTKRTEMHQVKNKPFKIDKENL